jgi:Ras-related protein Rab-11A
MDKAENGLFFIETSAQDASNVESAFQNILTGESPLLLQPVAPGTHPPYLCCAEVYRIVSSKQLESSADPIKPSGGETITVTPTVDNKANAAGGGCC